MHFFLKYTALFFFYFSFSVNNKANDVTFLIQNQKCYKNFKSSVGSNLEISDNYIFTRDTVEVAKYQNKKWIAIAATILLGPFGGHRLYLGASAKVPIVYTLTLGGGLGLLPLIDLIHIIATKELLPFEQNDKVFMWAK